LRDDVSLFVRSLVRWFVFCRLKRVLVGHWPGAAVLAAAAAVSGRSAAGPDRSVSDILMAARAYRVGHSGRTNLLNVQHLKQTQIL